MAAASAGLVLPEVPEVAYQVREVTARSALRRCTYPGIPWSLNPYQGCAHACAFCYVPALLHIERPAWGGFVLVKRNAPALLARELRQHPPALVAVGTATDPYQAVEARCRVTRHCLEVLARARWPVRVLTRSPLVLRDVEVFRAMDEVSVGMSVPTLDDEARRLLEPGAPSIGARLRCLRALADAGLPTFVSLAPCYPLTGGATAEDFAAALAEAGVGSVALGGYRPYGDSSVHVAARIRDGGIAGLEAMLDPAHMRGLAQALARALRARGVPVRGEGGVGA